MDSHLDQIKISRQVVLGTEDTSQVLRRVCPDNLSCKTEGNREEAQQGHWETTALHCSVLVGIPNLDALPQQI